MPTTAEDPVTATATLVQTLSDRITRVLAAAADDLDVASACDGWTAGDVLDHLVDTERDFLTGHGVELPSVPSADPVARWRAHAAAVVEALRDPAVVDHAFDGYFGPTTVGEAFEAFYCFDLVVHRWDLARALGGDTTLRPEELTLVEATVAASGEALYAPGVCDAPVELPDGASRQDRVLAATGRDPR